MSREFDKRVLRINCAGVLKTYWWCPDCGEMVKPAESIKDDGNLALAVAAGAHRLDHILEQ